MNTSYKIARIGHSPLPVHEIKDVQDSFAQATIAALKNTLQRLHQTTTAVGLAAIQLDLSQHESNYTPNIVIIGSTIEGVRKRLERGLGYLPKLDDPKLAALLIPTEIMVNPKIISYSGEVYDRAEGCFSLMYEHEGKIQGLLSNNCVKRYQTIDVIYLNENGESVQKTLSGFPAQVLQHEVSHGKHKEFIDEMHGDLEAQCNFYKELLHYFQKKKTGEAAELPKEIAREMPVEGINDLVQNTVEDVIQYLEMKIKS